jgi:hypothetical protein
MAQELWALKASYAATTSKVAKALEILVHCTNASDEARRTIYIYERGQPQKSHVAANEVPSIPMCGITLPGWGVLL